MRGIRVRGCEAPWYKAPVDSVSSARCEMPGTETPGRAMVDEAPGREAPECATVCTMGCEANANPLYLSREEGKEKKEPTKTICTKP